MRKHLLPTGIQQDEGDMKLKMTLVKCGCMDCIGGEGISLKAISWHLHVTLEAEQMGLIVFCCESVLQMDIKIKQPYLIHRQLNFVLI